MLERFKLAGMSAALAARRANKAEVRRLKREERSRAREARRAAKSGETTVPRATGGWTGGLAEEFDPKEQAMLQHNAAYADQNVHRQLHLLRI